MRIEIEKENLLYAVSAVERAISSKNTLPVLSGILIKAENNLVSFCSTDLELSISCVAMASVQEQGEIVAPGKKLSSLVRLLPNTTISLQTNGDKLEISYLDSRFTVPCFTAEEFPLLPRPQGEIKGSIQAPALRRLVRQVGIAASQDEIRPVFTAVHSEFAENSLTMVATDTHRLAKGSCEWNGTGGKALLIPGRSLQEVARLAANDNEDILIHASDNQAFFSFGNLTFSTRMIVGQYPDYRQVIPKDDVFTTEVKLSRQDLIESLERAALISGAIARGKGNIICLQISEKGLIVAAEAADEGMMREPIPAMISGNEVEINYNARYLLDVLKVISCENVRLLISGPSTPGLVLPEQAEGEQDDFLYLLLPVRISKPV